MADFYEISKKVKQAEGGYQNMPNDKGNYSDGKLIGTNWGIAADTLKGHLGRTPSISEMKNLSYETALKIYKKNFWDVIYGDEIKSNDTAWILYDAKVNQTGGFGFMVSNALNRIGNKNYSYYESPKMGVSFTKKTVQDINNSNQKKFFEAFKDEREKYYKYRASVKGQEGYLKGWMNRLSTFAYSGIETAKKHPVILIVATTAIILSVYFLIFGTKKINK